MEKGHEYPLPGIGKRKEGRHDLPSLPLETPQEKKNGHYGKDNAGPERHETRTRLTPGANFYCPSVEREKHPDTDEKQGRYAIVMIYFLFHSPHMSLYRIATGGPPDFDRTTCFTGSLPGGLACPPSFGNPNKTKR